MSLNWHDGVLSGLVLVPRWDKKQLMDLHLKLLLYPTPVASKRKLVNLVLQAVRRTKLDIDSLELQDNAAAGHISDAQIRRSRSGVSIAMTLTGGSIEVSAKKLKIN